MKKAKSQFLFIVDSDDYLADGTISFILDKTGPILHKNEILGIGVLQGTTDKIPFKNRNSQAMSMLPIYSGMNTV